MIFAISLEHALSSVIVVVIIGSFLMYIIRVLWVSLYTMVSAFFLLRFCPLIIFYVENIYIGAQYTIVKVLSNYFSSSTNDAILPRFWAAENA